MSRRHPHKEREGGATRAGERYEPRGPTVASARDNADARVRTLADRVAELEEELERRERRHRDVVRRYERLLADARGDGGGDEAVRSRDGGPLSRLRALLGR